ncbi:phage shock protein PspC (stress-responsive transcriptional regulator) [Pseudomonas sp. TE3610]
MWMGNSAQSAVPKALAGSRPVIDREAHMHAEGFFEWLGQALGAIIRFVVDSLGWLFNLLAHAGGNFVDGLSRTLGMDASLVSIIALVIGLMFLYSALRAFMRASIFLGVIWLILGLWLLSWIIH